MYYVIRTGEDVTMYHSAWTSFHSAVVEAVRLKDTYKREYEVLRMELVYATLTLRDEEE